MTRASLPERTCDTAGRSTNGGQTTTSTASWLPSSPQSASTSAAACPGNMFIFQFPAIMGFLNSTSI